MDKILTEQLLELTTEINGLYENLKAPISSETEELPIELDNRCQWLARSAEIFAQAQFINDKARGGAAETHLAIPSATLLRELINRDTAEEARVLKLAEKLNSTIVHQIDAIRSRLSFEKQLASLAGRSTPA